MTRVPVRDRRDESPLVSVVMSTYNGERFLAEQLETILAQSHRPLEILIRDDASSDATPAILRRYASRDARITFIPASENRGLAASLEILIRQSRGDFIAIADQDDVWRTDKIATLIRHIGRNAAVYSASRLIDGRGRDLGCTLLQAFNDRRPVSGRDPLRLFWCNTVSGHALMFRRSLAGRLFPFDPLFPYDHQIGIRALADGGLAYCDEPLVRHRIHGGNQTNGSVFRKLRRPGPGHAESDRVGLARTWAAKMRRRREARLILLRKLRFYQAGGVLQSISEREIRRAERSMRRFRRSFFNPALFVLLLKQSRLFGGGLDRIRFAFRHSKGARWQKMGYGLLRPYHAPAPMPRKKAAPVPWAR